MHFSCQKKIMILGNYSKAGDTLSLNHQLCGKTVLPQQQQQKKHTEKQNRRQSL